MDSDFGTLTLQKPAVGFSLPADLRISDKLTDNIERLNNIALLKQDWNGCGAKPFSHILLNRVKEIISNLYEQPDLFPTGRQSIQLEYHSTNGNYLEFEIFEERVIAMQVTGDDYDNAQFWELSCGDLTQIKQIAGNFVNAA